MSDEVTPEEWAAQLRLFLIQKKQEAQLVDRRELTPLQEWQCRVSGGALLKFLRFLSRPEYRSRHPELEEVGDKRLVCVTDRVGALAAHDILRMFRPQALWVLEDLWRDWIDETPFSDRDFRAHIEYYSQWTAAPERADEQRQLWIHRECYRLSAATGRDFEHLWSWADEELELMRADGNPGIAEAET